MDVLTLSRIQFAANITFHILFPTITIALGWFLLFFKLRYNRTQDPKWMEIYGFWVKVFALSFALGVVSGVTMSFQFGTNWPGFMEKVGNIAGPLLAYEVLTAFFLEATFLGIMLFGFRRVSNGVHTLATVLVAFGTTMSAFWIIVLNSWMQTPVGFEMIDGRAHATDWWAIVFSPSMPYRLTHMLIASGLTASFLIAGVSAYRWLRDDRAPAVVSALRTGIVVAAVLAPVQIVVGDMHGLNTLKHQPAKVAAIEGVWETERGAPMLFFALPDEVARENRYAFGIPKVASFILTHEWDGEIRGLDDFQYHPPVAPVFWSFRVMVGLGLAMLLASWLSAFQLRRSGAVGRHTARGLVLMTFSGWFATVAGWYVAEIGRQPYLVHEVLHTSQAVAQHPVPMVMTSLVLYIGLYALLTVSYVTVVFYLARKAQTKPAVEDPQGMSPVLPGVRHA